MRLKACETSWSLLHEVREKDMECQANVRAISMLQENVVHPENCKQNVRVALAILESPTIAAIKHYFSDTADSAEFLDLVNTW